MTDRHVKAPSVVAALVWIGTLVAIVIASHRDIVGDVAILGRMDGAVAGGRSAYARHHCGACHSMLGVGAGYAPELTSASQRDDIFAIRARLANGDLRDSNRKMPRKPLDETVLSRSEIGAVRLGTRRGQPHAMRGSSL